MIDVGSEIENDSTLTGRIETCSGNRTAVELFITTFYPNYFTDRPWIVGGLFTLATIGLVSNSGILLYLWRRPKLRRSAFSQLVMQLALADGMVSLLCLLADAIWNVTVEWLGGVHLCRFVKFTQMFSLYVSTMILTGMTIERCIAVTYPFTLSRPETSRHRVHAISLAVWPLAALCSTPQVLLFHVERAPICTEFLQCVTFGTYTESWQETLYTAFTSLVMFFIPVLIILCSFLILLAKISQETRLAFDPVTVNGRLNSNTEPNQRVVVLLNIPSTSGVGRRMFRQTRNFSLWTTFVIAVVFILCWGPYHVFMMVYVLHVEVSNSTMTVIVAFGMMSTVVNPLIYGVFRLIIRTPADRVRGCHLLNRLAWTTGTEECYVSQRRWTNPL